LETANIVILVVDASAAIDDKDTSATMDVRAAAAERTPVILVANKCDLVGANVQINYRSLAENGWQPHAVISCSALNGDGLTLLEDSLAQAASGGQTLDAEDTLVETTRQADSLRSAVEALGQAQAGLIVGLPPELVSVDLRTALEALGSVTGINVGEAVLDRIFSDFCIGK
jgi:tRNA modification GTPase